MFYLLRMIMTMTKGEQERSKQNCIIGTYWKQSNLATIRAFCSSRKMITETEKKCTFLYLYSNIQSFLGRICTFLKELKCYTDFFSQNLMQLCKAGVDKLADLIPVRRQRNKTKLNYRLLVSIVFRAETTN